MKTKSKKEKDINQLLIDNKIKKLALKKIANGLNTHKETIYKKS